MRRMKKWMIWTSSVLLIGAALVGCGSKKLENKHVKSSNDEVKQQEVSATDSTKTMTFPEKLVEIPQGYLFHQDPDISYTSDEVVSQNWESSEPSIIEVDKETGDVTALSNQSDKKVTISLTQILENGVEVKGSYQVVVQQRIKKLNLTSNTKMLSVGKTATITAKTSPSKVDNAELKWSSSNLDYAIVTAEGVVKAKSEGIGKTVTITARTTDGSELEKSIEFRILDPEKPLVALTFDDGPSYESTKVIVDALKKYNVNATFFVLGEHIEKDQTKNREILKESYQNGNEIASHTYDHKQLTLLSVKEIEEEAQKTSDLIKEVVGEEPKLLRPPYGASNDTVAKTLKYPLMLWSIDTLDWKTRNTESTIQSVLNNASDGSVVLMHDIHMPTALAVDRIVSGLLEKGFQIVTLSELADAKGITLENGQRYGGLHANQ